MSTTLKRILVVLGALALIELAAGHVPAALLIVAAAAVVWAFWPSGPRARALEPAPEPEHMPADLPDDERYTPAPANHLPAWQRPAQALAVRLASLWQAAILNIADRRFEPDWLLTSEQTRQTGIINAALRKHGELIEHAIREALQDRPDLAAWEEKHFRLSHGDTNYHKAVTVEGASLASLPYNDGDASHRSTQVDLIVFNRTTGVIRAYEIKRHHEDPASAHNLQIVGSLLKSYAETVKGVTVSAVEAWTISYYGEPSKSARRRITRDELDDHFGSPIRANVERMTADYRAALQSLLTGPNGPAKPINPPSVTELEPA
jgi:hypothetical protein